MPQAPNYPYAPHVMQYTAAYHRIHISTELSRFYQSLSYFISYHIISQLTISYRTSLKMREEQILKRSALSPRERKGIHMKFYGMQKLSLLDFPAKCAPPYSPAAATTAARSATIHRLLRRSGYAEVRPSTARRSYASSAGARASLRALQ